MMDAEADQATKILLAEDDNDMRRFLVKALQNAGFVVTSFDNGLAAYHRLREEPFELLLTDIVMPEMDGIELARRATELDPDIKVMFITGFAAVALNPDNNAPRDAKILSKPFHLKDLVGEVQRLLGRLSRLSQVCLHLEFEAALILLRKCQINRGVRHARLLSLAPGEARRLLGSGLAPSREGRSGDGRPKECSPGRTRPSILLLLRVP